MRSLLLSLPLAFAVVSSVSSAAFAQGAQPKGAAVGQPVTASAPPPVPANAPGGVQSAPAPTPAAAAATPPPNGGAIAVGSDQVTLKSGGMLRGTLVEFVPNDHATLQLANGQTARVEWNVIEKVERFQAPAAASTAAVPPPPPAPSARSLRYDGGAPPPGYHVESHARLGLLIPGAILTGIGALCFLGAATAKSYDGEVVGVTFGVLFAAPGLPLLIVGAAAQKKEYVRDGAGEEASNGPARANANANVAKGGVFLAPHVERREGHVTGGSVGLGWAF